jgi:hypothetical protein
MKISESFAEIIGMTLGDGCISVTKRYCEFALLGDRNEEREYYENYVIPLLNKELFVPLLNKQLFGKEYKKSGVFGVYCFRKEVVDKFLEAGLKSGSKLHAQIPESILKDQKLTYAFLRGIFDTDGSLYFNKNYSTKIENRIHNRPRLKLEITSLSIIKQVFEVLKLEGYSPYLKPPYKGKRDTNPLQAIILQKKKDVERFLIEIGLRSIKHLTKWAIYQKCGFCPPKTTIKERKAILENHQNVYKTLLDSN